MTDNERMTSKEDSYQATFSKEGRLLIPKALREALSVNAGDVVVLKVEKGELRITPKSKYLKDLKKKLSAKHAGKSLSKELIAQRRKEAGNE